MRRAHLTQRRYQRARLEIGKDSLPIWRDLPKEDRVRLCQLAGRVTMIARQQRADGKQRQMEREEAR